MNCCASISSTPDSCKLFLLTYPAAAVGITLFVIGIIAYCNVGALQGVNTVTSYTLISMGSAALAIELLIAFLFFIKKDSPLSYADYARLKSHIHENEYVFYYDSYNPNLALCAYYYNGNLHENLHRGERMRFFGGNADFTKLSLNDLQRRNGEFPSSRWWTFFVGDGRFF